MKSGYLQVMELQNMSASMVIFFFLVITQSYAWKPLSFNYSSFLL